MRGGRGAEGQKYKIKPLGLDLGALSEMEVESSEGRWHNGVDEVVVVVGHCIHKCEAGESVCAKKPKPSRHGLISGAPCETAKEDGGGGGVVVCMRWWQWWGCALAKREAGRGFEPKPKTELLWLDLGRAV